MNQLNKSKIILKKKYKLLISIIENYNINTINLNNLIPISIHKKAQYIGINLIINKKY